jgi:hypothetical protein
MKKIFKKHPEFVLVSLAAFFLLVLAIYFFWGITTMVSTLNKAIAGSKAEEAAVGFDLKGAAGLNLKGPSK